MINICDDSTCYFQLYHCYIFLFYRIYFIHFIFSITQIFENKEHRTGFKNIKLTDNLRKANYKGVVYTYVYIITACMIFYYCH